MRGRSASVSAMGERARLGRFHVDACGSSIGPGRSRSRRPVPGEGTGLARYLFAALLAGARLAGPSWPARAWREPCVLWPCGPVPSWRRPGRSLLGGSRSGGLAGGGDGGVAGRVRTLHQLGCRGRGQDGVLERLHRGDARLLGSLDADRLTRRRVATHAGGPVHLDELGEAGDGDRLTLRDDGGDDIGESVDDGDTVFNSTSAWTATAFASSLLFMAPIVADARPAMHIFPGTNADFCAQTFTLTSARKRPLRRARRRSCNGLTGPASRRRPVRASTAPSTGGRPRSSP